MVEITCDEEGCDAKTVGTAQLDTQPLRSACTIRGVALSDDADGWWHGDDYWPVKCPRHAPKKAETKNPA